MSWVPIPADLVILIHDTVLNPGELQGPARDKSTEGALGRVENRVNHGRIGDVFDLGAAYAEAVSQGHRFDDANKRTAYAVMVVAMQANGLRMTLAPDIIGPRIIDLAQGRLAAGDLAARLRRAAET
ncbi:type II toxin-antitoxin system death-on-curing family toxin [Rhodobacterales bacterium HKCCSP123]|nr:type II toxin-antitoxin system death-on-curing family toxin [Rhodobacterales bacterium HKCCSP123]